MRGDRLLMILLLLQNHGKLSAVQLAKKLEVSKRTIIRDMDALSAAGVPVYAERGSNGGWKLLEGYSVSLTGMKKDELIALLFGSGSLPSETIGYRKHYAQAFEKLLAASPEAIRREAEAIWDKVHIDGAGWHEATEECPFLPVIQKAIWDDRRLAMAYHGSERTVSPLGLIAKRNVWYLAADTEAGLRIFRVSRVEYAAIQDETFERPKGFDLAAYWRNSSKQFVERLPSYPAQVRIRADGYELFKQRRYVRIISEAAADNGFIEADVEFQSLESACNILLGFGAGAEALAPQELRSAIISELAAARQLYEQ